MRMFRFSGMAAGLLLAGGAAMAAPPALYTEGQAKAGADVFAQNCALCHGADLKGGAAPALVGQGFAPEGGGIALGGVFTMVAQQMPQNAPGSLSQTQYEDVMAYILQANGYPAGATPLAYKATLGSTQPLASQVK